MIGDLVVLSPPVDFLIFKTFTSLVDAIAINNDAPIEAYNEVIKVCVIISCDRVIIFAHHILYVFVFSSFIFVCFFSYD